MYLQLLSISIIICLANGVLSASLFSPCKISDSSCLEKTVNAALPRIFSGIPELGVETCDPQFNDVIVANLPTLKLELINSTLIGYKDCILSNISFNKDVTSVRCNAICKSFEVSGKYIMSGQLLSFPIEGNGDFKFKTGIFHATIDTQLEKTKRNDGKTYLTIKKFKVNSKPKTPITFNFQNLFNGDKKLSDAVHKFANENWLGISELLQYPIWYKSLDTLSKSVNKYLESFALEDLIL